MKNFLVNLKKIDLKKPLTLKTNRNNFVNFENGVK